MHFGHIDDKTLTILLLLAVIVLGPLIMTKLRLPALTGLLLGGMLIGPNGFDLLPFRGDVIDVFGNIGLLLLMFLAGLELDLPSIRPRMGAVVGFGLLSFAGPFVLGTAAGLLFDYSMTASVLIGSLWASHTLVTIGVLRSHDRASSPGVSVVIGATAITDGVALAVLSLVVATDAGGSAIDVGTRVIAGFVVTGLFAWFVLPPVARWMWTRPRVDRGARYSMLLLLMFSTAGVAELAGVEAIIGAFLAGIVLNRIVPAHSSLMEQLEFASTSFFVPAFLVSVGLIIDLEVLRQLDTLLLTLAFLVATVVGKAGAAVLGGRLYGFSRLEVIAAFGLSVNQAAATLAAAFVALEAGIIDDVVINAVIGTILFSLIIGVVVTEWVVTRLPPVQSELRLGRHVIVDDGEQVDQIANYVHIANWLTSWDGGHLTVLEPVVSLDASAAQLAGQRGVEVDRVLDTVGVEAHVAVRAGVTRAAAVHNAVTDSDASFVLVPRDATAQAAAEPLPVPHVVVHAPSEATPRRVVLLATYESLHPHEREELAWCMSIAARLAQHHAATLHVIVADDFVLDSRFTPQRETWAQAADDLQLSFTIVSLGHDELQLRDVVRDEHDVVVAGASLVAELARLVAASPVSAMTMLVTPPKLEPGHINSPGGDVLVGVQPSNEAELLVH